MLNDDNSDIEGFSDDSDADPDYQPPERLESTDDEGSDDDFTLPARPVTPDRPSAADKWRESREFIPLPAAPPPEVDATDGIQRLNPLDAFFRYVPEDVIDSIALATSQKILAATGRATIVTSTIMKQFFALNIMMSYHGYPRIRMYWAQKTKIPKISETMTRNMFFLIRNNLCTRDYNQVTNEEKQSNRFWKVAPLLKSVRQACLENPRGAEVSMDEQMIPFHGKTGARQFVKNKPNPVGLKNFVCTSPDGLPLDFFIYEGKGDSVIEIDPKLKMDIGGKVILKLSQTLPEGCSIFMDRYFSSVTLLDQLFAQGFHASGTLQKNRIPKDCVLKTDSELRKNERGTFYQLVRDDGQVVIIQWLDNKPVVVISNCLGGQPEDMVRRWCKTTKQYVNVKRPNVIAEYNKKMGGVDFLDRMIAYYRIAAKTRRWTVRVMFHFIDFALAASWFERRRIDALDRTPKRDSLDFLDWKVEVSDALVHHKTFEEVEDDRNGQENQTLKKRKTAPLPSDALRTTGVLHLPEIPPGAKPSRCRFPGCTSPKCLFWCSTCKVFLCLNTNRNCFKPFHEM